MTWPGPPTRVDSRQLRRYVVRVDSAEGDTVLGTGFFIAPGWVLTCAHVVFDPRRESEVDEVLLVPDPQVSAVPVGAVVTARSAPPRGTVLWTFPDLALLRLTGRLDHPCVRLDPGEPLGGECHAWGFPRREYGALPPGSPASFGFEGVEGDGFLKLKTGQAAPGLSGAPLLCPVRRAVVGVICATRDTDSDLGGWASPIRALLTGGPGIPDTLAAHAQEITRLNTAAVLADRTAWNKVLPVHGSDDLLDQPWATFTRKPRSTPSELLLADVAVVPYLFRDTDLAHAQQWCEGPAAFEVAQVAARGGAGKTRFAIELCRRMADHGWTTGLWARDQPIDAIAATPLPRLIVIDYTEAIAVDTLRDALKHLANHADPVAPVRLLLLTRTAAGGTTGVLEQLAARANARLRTILADAQDNNAARTLLPEQRRNLYNTAVGAFTDAWYPDAAPHTSTGTIQLDQDRYGLPLEVLFEAFDHALSDHQVDDDRAPVDRVLDHEQRYWDATAPPDLPTELRRTAVALATLAGAADTSRAHALLALLPHLADPATDLRQRTARWLADLYPGPQRLNPLRPDRLGEALVADVLNRHDDGGRALLASVLDLSDDDQVADCLDVLARLTAASDRATPAVTTVLAARHRELVDRAETQARGTPQRPGRLTLTGALTRVFNTLAEGLAAGEPGNTTYARDLTVSYNKLADLAVATGQAAEAERLFRQALTIREGLAAGEPGNTTYARDLSISYERLADLAVATGQAAEAERLFHQSLTIREGLAAGEPGNTTYARDLTVSYNKLADLAVATGQAAEAERLFRQALTIAEGLAAGEPGNTTYARDLSISYERLADLAVATGQAAEAERLFRQALTIREGLAAGEPGNTTYARDLSISYERLADLAVATGQAGEGERLFRQSLAIAEGLAAGEPGNTTYARDLSISYNKLADLAVATGQAGEGERLFRQSLAIREGLAAGEPGNTTYARDLSISYNKLADLAVATGQAGEGERLFRQSLAIAEGLAAGEPGNTTYARDLTISYERLADLDRRAGRVSEAGEQFHRAVGIRRRLCRREPRRIDLAEELAVALRLLADTAEEDREIRQEAIAVLAPFERLGVVTPKGVAVLRWARSEPSG